MSVTTIPPRPARRRPFAAPHAFVLAVLLFALPVARAVTKTWNGTTGNWTTDASWAPANTPAATDDVIVNAGTAQVGSNAAVKSLTISAGAADNGTVAIDGTSGVLKATATSYFGYGGVGKLELTNKASATFVGSVMGQLSGARGTLNILSGSEFTAQSLVMGAVNGTINDMTVSGTGSKATLTAGFTLAAGTGTVTITDKASAIFSGSTIGSVAGGNGILNVTGGGQFIGGSGSFRLGTVAGASGTVNIDGEGSVFSTTASQFGLGVSGSGALNVTNGATASVVTINAGSTANSVGTVLVDHATLTASGVLQIATASTDSSLTVRNDGLVTATTIFLGMNSGSRGTLNVGTGGAGGTVTGNIYGGSGTAAVNFNHTDAGIVVPGVLYGTLAVNQLGSGRTILAGNSTYTGSTTISGGTLQLGNGGTTGSVATNILNNAALVVDRSNDLLYAGVISGSGTLAKRGAGTLILSGAHTYAGATTVEGGRLFIDGSAATATVGVAGGATLGGRGTLTGAVTVADQGRLSPGAVDSVGTLTVGSLTLNSNSQLDYQLGREGAAFIGGTNNDLIHVTGNLTLAGALNVADAGEFSEGTYRLINYDGTLTNNTLALGTLPVGFTTSDMFVQTAPGQVNLVVAADDLAFQYWDGAQVTANNVVDGGTSTWLLSTRNWTNATGSTNTPWAPGWAIFWGQAGTVTLGENIPVAGMQFLTDGYLVTAGSSSFRINADPNLAVFVNPGVTATISAVISDGPTGPATLVKADPGTLVLSGANTYTGGTLINGGTVQVAADGNLGAAAGQVTFNGGTLRYGAAFNTGRAFNVDSGGGTLDTNGFNVTYTGSAAGPGVLTKTGDGTLIVTGRQDSLGGTLIAGGTLQVGDGGATGNLSGPIVNNATLVFNRSDDDFRYAGAVTGSGAFIKRGPGTLTLTGASTMTGTATIESGVLKVNGSIASPVSISAAGTLTGNGIVGTTTNGGRLAAGDNGIGILTINGTYTNLSTGTVEGQGDPAGNGDVIRVNGNAVLQGGMVDIRPEPGTYVGPLRYLMVDTTGGVDGTYTGILQEFAFFKLSLEYTPTQVYVVANPAPIDNPDIAAISFNTDSVAGHLDAIRPVAGGELLEAMRAISLMDTPEAARALNSLTGEIHPTTAGLLNEGHALFGQSVTRRLAEIRTGPATAGWVRPYGVVGNLKSDGNGPAVDYDLAGVAAGVDRTSLGGYTAGASFNASDANLDFRRYAGHSDAQTYDAALYGSRSGEHWYLDGVLAYAWLDTRTRRQIEVNEQIRHTATAQYDGQRAAFYLEAGRRVAPGRWVFFEPVATAQYTWQRQDGFSETGAGDLGLRSDAFTTESLRTGLGGRLGLNLSLGGWRLTPEIRARWLHEFLDEYSHYEPAFIGVPDQTFEIRGTAIDRDSYVAGAGVTLAFRENLSISVDYDLRFNADIEVNNFTAGVRYAW